MIEALTLDQLRTFVAVAEAGSFRSGAARLSRVQSAVSHAIGNLEAQLRVKLFDRTTQRPTLTAEGRALLEDARAVLLKVDFLKARARGLGQGVEIELALYVDTLFPIHVVAAALHDLREKYPGVAVRLSVAALGAPLAALRERRCALSIIAGEDFRDPRIEFETLASLSFVAVAASSHPLAARAGKGEVIGAVELADHLQIVQEDPTSLSEGRDFGVLSPSTWRVNSQEAKLALIRAGLGWGRLPDWLVQKDIAEGRLVGLQTAGLGRRGETIVTAYLARRMDEPLGVAARALRDALHRQAGARPERGKQRSR